MRDRENRGGVSLADEHTSPADATIQGVGPGVYAYYQPDGGWYINNSTIIVGRHGAIVVDAAATETRTTALRAAIASVTTVPVSTLVNTHWHTDHTNGNYQFRPATIVSHDLCRETLIANGISKSDPASNFPDIAWGHLELAPPFLTFDNRVTLWSDSVRCEVVFAGTPAHTTSDSYVWIPELGILAAGDLVFNGSAPLVSAGSVTGSLAVLDQLAALKPTVVIPGHGQVCGPEVFDEISSYLRFLQDVAAKGHAAGRTPLEAAIDAGEHAFSGLLDGERLAGNLHRAYAEIEGAQPGVPIDLAATRRDMLAYNGGQPLRCNA